MFIFHELLNEATNRFEIVTAQSDREKVYNYLVTNSPNLAAYDYKPWTEDESNFVQSVVQTINNYANTGTYGQNVAMATSITAPPYPQPTVMGQTTSNQMPHPTMPTPAAPPVMPPIQTNAQPSVMMPTPAAPVYEMQQPTMPEMPTAPSIMGIDLPDVGGPMPEMAVNNPEPQVVGMGLDSIYNNI